MFVSLLSEGFRTLKPSSIDQLWLRKIAPSTLGSRQKLSEYEQEQAHKLSYVLPALGFLNRIHEQTQVFLD